MSRFDVKLERDASGRYYIVPKITVDVLTALCRDDVDALVTYNHERFEQEKAHQLNQQNAGWW